MPQAHTTARIAKLKFYFDTGWGVSPTKRKEQSRVSCKVGGLGILSTLLLYLIPFLLVRATRPYSPILFFGEFIRTIFLFELFVAAMFVYACVQFIQAHKAESEESISIRGYCLEYILNGDDCIFAKVGMNVQDAKWYVLPVQALSLLSDRPQLRITLSPSTGWVQEFAPIDVT